MNNIRDLEKLHYAINKSINLYNRNKVDLFLPEDDNIKQAIAVINATNNIALIQDITKPDDDKNQFLVHEASESLEVELGTDITLDNNDYNMQFSGEITNSQIDILLDYKPNFNFNRLTSIIYKSNSNHNMIWFENNIHEFLSILYVDEIGKQYWELEKFNNQIFHKSYDDTIVEC